jgi:hypothetical protein
MSNDFYDRCWSGATTKTLSVNPWFRKGVSMCRNDARGPSGRWERSVIVDLSRSASRPRQPTLAGQSDSDVPMEFGPRYLRSE